MQLIRGYQNSKTQQCGCVLTIGNFDGVHRGHQAVLEQARQLAEQHDLPLALMVFEPTPQQYFLADRAGPRLMSWREKYQALDQAGVDYFICQPFTADFAQMSAVQFIAEVLLQQLNVKALVVGSDFHFGAKRQGDVALLQASAVQHGFSCHVADEFHEVGSRVSSTRLRGLLDAGDLHAVTQLLGRPYRISGRVGYGRKLGRTFGFPTANIRLAHPPALRGIFAVQVHGIDEQVYWGAASIGVNPAVTNDGVLVLEVYVLDYQGDLYGKRLAIDFIEKLRDEQNFDSLQALSAQIARDVALVKKLRDS